MLGTLSADELAVMWRSAPAHALRRVDQQVIPPPQVPHSTPREVSLAPSTRWRIRGAAGSGKAEGGVIPGGIDDGVSSVSQDGDDAADLGLRIRGMAADIAATMCEWLHLIERFDRSGGWFGAGIASCAAWLSWTCSISPTTAREYVRVARALITLPLIDEAFAEGRLSYSKVRVLVKVAADVDEKTLLEQARVQTVSQLERTVRAFRRSDSRRQEQERRASWHWDDDGMLCLSARLPADEGALLIAALEQVRDELRAEMGAIAEGSAGRAEAGGGRFEGIGTGGDGVGGSRAGGDGVGGSRAGGDRVEGDGGPHVLTGVNPMDAARADMLIGLAHRSVAAGSTDSSGDDRHLMVVHIDADQLVDSGDPSTAGRLVGAGQLADRPAVDGASRIEKPPALPGPRCHIENGPGLDSRTAARISCDAALVHVIHGISADEPLALGRKTRRISPAQRRALRIRDGGCVFPGCHRCTHLDAHHVLPWSLGGRTDLDNLALLCRFHHFLVHEGGYTVAAAGEFRSAADEFRSAADELRNATGGPKGKSGEPRDAAGCAWVFHDPHGDVVPAVPELPGTRRSSYLAGTVAGPGHLAAPAWGSEAVSRGSEEVGQDSETPGRRNSEALLPEWRGEPFHLADIVGVFARAGRGST